MQTTRELTLVGLALILSVTGTAAVAQDSGWVLGASIGASHAKQGCDGVPISCDNKDTGWKIFGGYQFNRNISAELAYVGLGKVTANGTIGGVPVSADAEGEGWELSVVGMFPISPAFSVLGRLGVFRWDVDATATAGVPALARATANATGTDLTYGLGVQYNFSRTVAGRLEWQRFNNVGDSSTTGQSDVDLFSLGISIKF